VRLTIQLFASLRERAGRAQFELDDLPDELDVHALKRELALRVPELGALTSVRAVIGMRYVSDDTRLASGTVVALLPPVSGGAPDRDDELARGLFELVSDALDIALAQRRVEHASCGAVCVFTGTTRDNNRGKRVVRLEYEAFEAMTGPEMARIFERCRSELDTNSDERALRMLVQHRVGVVQVGEPSVVIAVASPHRELAFRACRFLIDELKASLPVWKKEIYPDGEHWIGERS
jgi:molybdopterin synthase catalytic subunit/molybdopterin converting factor small subunit